MGVDPGTATTGYGVVAEEEGELELVAFGAVITPAGQPLPNRLQTIYQELSSLVAKHSPAAGAVEKLFFSKNVRTAMNVGQARGVALLALANAGLAIGEYSPPEIKQAVTGYGSADKAQVQEMVRVLLGMDDIPRPDDAADGLAVAICHLHALRLQSLLDA